MSSARESFRAAICRVGGPAELLRGERAVGAFTACLQPRGQPGEQTALPIGAHTASRHLLYAPSGGAADEMSAGDSIVFAGVRYYVRQTEPVYFGGETVYHKAYLLKEQEGEY